MVQIVVSIGSNIQREKNICAALDNLSDKFGELCISPVYKSMANGPGLEESLFYYNLVVAFQTELAVNDIKPVLRSIEDQQGRQRNIDVVSLDIDLLLCGEWIGEYEGSAIPHGDIAECAYVLRPLMDLFPDQKHPVFGKAYSELWQSFSKELALVPVDFIWNQKIISTAVCLSAL